MESRKTFRDWKPNEYVFCLSWTLSEFDELEYSSPQGGHDVHAKNIFPRAEGGDRSPPLAGERERTRDRGSHGDSRSMA